MRAGFFLTRALGIALSVPILIGLAACAVSREQASTTPASAGEAAGMSAAEPAYQQPTATPAANIDQALADLKHAEDEISLAFEALSESQGRKSPTGMPAPGATADSAVPKAAQPTPTTAPSRSAETELTSNPCFSACRALASMSRATAHLCDLAGDTDPRCDNARSRLRGARERVEGSCACGPPG